MKKLFFTLLILIPAFPSIAQSLYSRLSKAWQVFEADVQLQHSTCALYVVNARTGKVVFNRNAMIGLAPASTQKIITSATAFELLGKDYRFPTRFYIKGKTVFVEGSGDPTLGSWRYAATKDTAVFKELISGLKKAGLGSIEDLKIIEDDPFHISLPAWINEDVANYYGAPSFAFNWHENQYDLAFLPGRTEGNPAPLDQSMNNPYQGNFINRVTTGPPGSGDNAYIYFMPGSRQVVIKGTVPPGPARFTISGADYSPGCSFSLAFLEYAGKAGFFKGNRDTICTDSINKHMGSASLSGTPAYIYYSPSLDSIIYWFNRKSINLYGEALINTLAPEKGTAPSAAGGIELLKDFWKTRGIEPTELNMVDGSGLSPLNRVTVHSQVHVLQYARQKAWFPAYFDSFPEYNGMKMKSGTIRGAKGFCGYHRARDGNEYIFSFLVNNYNGPAASVVQKMYKVLDLLK